MCVRTCTGPACSNALEETKPPLSLDAREHHLPEQQPCSICCREAPAPPAAAVNCPARHAFCEPCIRQALTTPSAGGSRCPNCRAAVTELRCPPDAEQPEPVAPLAAAAEPAEEEESGEELEH